MVVDISLFSSIASQYEDWRSVRTAATVNAMSHLLVEQILDRKLAVDLVAGFQRFSNFTEQVSKYTRLSTVCKRVFVFGVPDIQPPAIPGVKFISLDPESALSRERFLAVNSADFWAAMLAQEVEGSKTPEGKGFDGGWLYEEEVVEQVWQLISPIAGLKDDSVITRNYKQQNAHITQLNKSLLLHLQAAELGNHRRWMQLDSLQQFSAILLQHQPLPCILRDAVKILTTLFGAKDAAIALNLQGNQFMIFSGGGKLNTGKPLSSLGHSASSQALNLGKLISVPDVQQTEEPEPLVPKAKSLLAAPIKGRRRVHGVVTVGSNEINGWNEEDGQTVMAIANMLAVIIEQKAQVSGDIVLQLRRARQLEQMLTKLRKPMARLLYLQQKLQDEVQLLPIQQELMAEVEALYTEVAKTIWAPKTPPSVDDSALPPPPKPAQNLN